jgi:hypothetical protein
VVVANPLAVKAIARAQIKTDTIVAWTLAYLLRADLVPEVAMPDEATWELGHLTAHRQFLGKRLVAVKNTVRGVLNNRLLDCSRTSLPSSPVTGCRPVWPDTKTRWPHFVASDRCGFAAAASTRIECAFG